MSYNQRENSKQSGRPVELFLFQYGSDLSATYGITSAPVSIEYDGITYEPATVFREEISTSGRLDENEVGIDVSRNDTLAQMLQGYPPSWVISVIVRQGHMPDPAYPNPGPGAAWPVCFTGRVIERVGGEGASVRLVCVPSVRSVQRVGLRRNYQWSCPHALYGPLCKADKEVATTMHEIIQIQDNLIELGAFPPSGRVSANYIGGMVEWQGPVAREFRTVISAPASNRLRVSGPLGDLALGDMVETVLGCAHDMLDCREVHNNILNYGGHPFIPQNNPFFKNNHD